VCTCASRWAPCLGGPSIDLAINTHWYDDNAEGNKVLGPAGVPLIARTNSREMLTKHNSINLVRTVLDQPAYPPAAWRSMATRPPISSTAPTRV
jgi:glutaredoxin 2